MLKLNYLSVIRFSGVDAGSFLHSQVSADVLALANGESTFACYCEPKGRVLALLLVHRVEEDYYVILSGALATAVTERLTIYRMRAKASIELLTNYSVSGLHANNEPELALKSAFAIRLQDSSQWLVVRAGDLTDSADETSQDEWKAAELRLGISWLNPATSGEFLPQMLGFEQLGAVNYRKGCYPGQEIVARTHYLGKVKRHARLVICKLPISPQPMDKVNILSDEETYEAVIADCGSGDDGQLYLLTVTRMEPELSAERIEFLDEVSAVS